MCEECSRRWGNAARQAIGRAVGFARDPLEVEVGELAEECEDVGDASRGMALVGVGEGLGEGCVVDVGYDRLVDDVEVERSKGKGDGGELLGVRWETRFGGRPYVGEVADDLGGLIASLEDGGAGAEVAGVGEQEDGGVTVVDDRGEHCW